MAFDYERLESSAKSMIHRFGRNITYKIDVYNDPARPWESAPTSTEETEGKAVFSDFASNEVDGSTVRSDDINCMISADTFSMPSIAGKIVDGSDTYDIVSVKVEKPGDTAIYYDLHLRRGRKNDDSR